MIKKKPKFIRLGHTQYSKLGLRRKNKLKYRKAKGGENKVRLKMKGHLRNVNIGFRSQKDKRELIKKGIFKGLYLKTINNLKEIKLLEKNEIAIIGKVGNKKRKEILDYALKNKISVFNINPKKTLEKIENEFVKRKEERLNKKKRIIEGDKRAKTLEKKKEESEKKDEKKLEDNVKDYESDIKENVEGKK